MISSSGSIDWLCWPRFDSPSIFAALLEAEQGGRFVVRPSGEFRTERRYIPDTNVLETVFHTPDGSVVLRDAMSVASDEYARHDLMPAHEILREIEGLSGEVEVEIVYEPRPRYGRQDARVEQRSHLGVYSRAGQGVLILRGDMPFEVLGGGRCARARVHIRAGERRFVSLAYSDDAPMVLPLLGTAASERMEQSRAWWQEWVSRCTYKGPYRDAVVRSLLTLKLMCFSPSGAVIAAPTTSLPEEIGGERNWDYRYCWLRDAAFTVRALLDLGYEDEAAAYCGWLLHATRLSWPELEVLYDVFGRTQVPEGTLDHFAGYAGSRPVRVGNAAQSQLQLDVYGEVLDAISRLEDGPEFFDRDTLNFLEGLGRTVCNLWREPDAGIWESRADSGHYTHSKVLCWVALDRLIRLKESRGLNIDIHRFSVERDAIRAEVERRGYNKRIGSYTQVFDGDDVDASLLTLPWYGYIDARDPRMMSTRKRISEQLGRGALVYRYAGGTDDGLQGSEGAFGVCGFWAVDCRARAGDLGEAVRAFEQLLLYANDVGLFAEETDPDTGAALGNMPQAFTHVGAINAALTLLEYEERGTSAYSTSNQKGNDQ